MPKSSLNSRNNLKTQALSCYQSENVQLRRQIFFYVDKVNRDHRGRYFKEVKRTQAIDSVLSGSSLCSVRTCQLSCYCKNCMEEDYKACQNSDYVTAWQTAQLETETLQLRNFWQRTPLWPLLLVLRERNTTF